jgi:hypothetical protein
MPSDQNQTTRAVMIFFRAGGMFYPVQANPSEPLAVQAAKHAGLNPGTVRIEDAHGNVLWSLQ